jgi:polyadenylate-binding protein 2
MSKEEEEVDYGEDEEYDENADADAEGMMRRMIEMDQELESLGKAQGTSDGKPSASTESVDDCSIYVGQVDYEATAEELRAHFSSCGTINRVTIMTDARGNAKGYAYIEFAEKVSVENALKLDDTPFKGRQLKVVPKRTNIAAFARGGDGGGRGRGRFGGRGRFDSGRGRGRSFGGRFGGRFSGRGGRVPAHGRGGGGRWHQSYNPY